MSSIVIKSINIDGLYIEALWDKHQGYCLFVWEDGTIKTKLSYSSKEALLKSFDRCCTKKEAMSNKKVTADVYINNRDKNIEIVDTENGVYYGGFEIFDDVINKESDKLQAKLNQTRAELKSYKSAFKLLNKYINYSWFDDETRQEINKKLERLKL